MDEALSGTPRQRVELALEALKAGNGIIVADNADRENEGDVIYAAESLTDKQMALLIRECSGIVCLCLTPDKAKSLHLDYMVKDNTSRYGTAFTCSIEAAEGVTTGVSAKDRVTTIKAAVNPAAKPSDLNRPGHVFPLIAKAGGVLERNGHTEATVDMMKLAGLQPAGVLCELTLSDGRMAKMPELMAFSRQENLPLVTVEDIAEYRKQQEN